MTSLRQGVESTVLQGDLNCEDTLTTRISCEQRDYSHADYACIGKSNNRLTTYKWTNDHQLFCDSQIYSSLSAQNYTLYKKGHYNIKPESYCNFSMGYALPVAYHRHSDYAIIPFNSDRIDNAYRMRVFDIPSFMAIQSNRISAVTVKWILQNFEIQEGYSLRRSVVYELYLKHCQDDCIDCVNQASFGKLLRSIFVGLGTRRLGTSGGRTKNNPEMKITSTVDSICRKDFMSADEFLKIQYKYQISCKEITQAVASCELNKIEHLFCAFWKEYSSSQETMALLDNFCRSPEALSSMNQIDNAMYSEIVYILYPNFAQVPNYCSTRIARLLSCNLIYWLETLLASAPTQMRLMRVSKARCFVNKLNRMNCISRLSHTAKEIIQSKDHVDQMVKDLDGIEFQTIYQTCSWLFQCSHECLRNVETSLKTFLRLQCDLTVWIDWLHRLYNGVLQGCSNGSISKSRIIRSFMFKWSTLGSIFMRDLTMRNATSFGSFNVFRILLDELLMFIAENALGDDIIPIKCKEENKATMTLLKATTCRKRSSTECDSTQAKHPRSCIS